MKITEDKTYSYTNSAGEVSILKFRGIHVHKFTDNAELLFEAVDGPHKGCEASWAFAKLQHIIAEGTFVEVN